MQTPHPTDDRDAKEELFATLYHELHRLAHRAINRNGKRFSLDTTTLLHELYLSIRDRDQARFPDSERFLAYAARAMRGIVIDMARQRRTLKRGAGFKIVELEENIVEGLAEEQDLVRIDEAVQALAAINPPLAELVDLRYFCGLTLAEIGALQGVTERTLHRKWEKARLLLFNLLSNNGLR